MAGVVIEVSPDGLSQIPDALARMEAMAGNIGEAIDYCNDALSDHSATREWIEHFLDRQVAYKLSEEIIQPDHFPDPGPVLKALDVIEQGGEPKAEFLWNPGSSVCAHGICLYASSNVLDRGDIETANEFIEFARKCVEENGRPGEEHSFEATINQRMARIEGMKGDWEKAAEYYTQAHKPQHAQAALTHHQDYENLDQLLADGFKHSGFHYRKM